MINIPKKIRPFILEAFIALVTYNIFFIKDQRGTVMVAALVIYTIYHYSAKKRTIKLYFRDGLAFMALSLIFALFNQGAPAKIAMDYFFLFMLFGSLAEIGEIAKNRKEE